MAAVRVLAEMGLEDGGVMKKSARRTSLETRTLFRRPPAGVLISSNSPS